VRILDDIAALIRLTLNFSMRMNCRSFVKLWVSCAGCYREATTWPRRSMILSPVVWTLPLRGNDSRLEKPEQLF
jgi:hypothetical protein